MQRIEYDGYGGHELMHLAAFSPPPLGDQEVCTRVVAASVNPFDWKVREGELKLFTGSRFPRAMGSDFSGIVESVGRKVTRFAVGDPVVGTTSPKESGAFAEVVIVHEKYLIKKPNSLSHAEAAVLPIPGVTAWLALIQRAKLQRGQHVLINGALGSVGRAAISVASSVGAKLAGRVGPGSHDEARSLGLSSTFDYNGPIPSSALKSFDVVFDCNGSLTPQQGESLVKPGGMVIDINLTRAKFWRALFRRHRKLVFFNRNAETLQKIVEFAAAGKLKLPIGRTAKLTEAIPMITDVESGRHFKGKAVIQFTE
jgi:NADPH:quinone reductase-like Zn-dependent oxidoreductase